MNSDSIVQPPRLAKIPAGLERAILFPVDPFARRELSSVPRPLVKKEFSLLFTRFWVLSDRVVVCPALGAPQAAMITATLAAAGIRRLLVAGPAGSLDGELGGGEIAVIRQACSACGTTGHYFPGREWFSADPDFLLRLQAGLQKQSLPCRLANAVTTDAPYRETEEFCRLSREKDCQVVEMEMAGVLAAAEWHGLAAAGVLVVSDRVAGQQWERGMHLVKYALTMRKLLPMLWSLDF